MMNDGSILYVPIQINGGKDKPTNLKDRELYILDDGTLYVGKKNTDGTIEVVTVAGRVIDNASIKSPKFSGAITLGEDVSPYGKEGTLVFADGGQFGDPEELSKEEWIAALKNLVTRMENLTPGSGTVSNQIIDATVE